MRKTFVFIITVMLISCIAITANAALTVTGIDGTAGRTTQKLYDGVKLVHLTLDETSVYGRQEIYITEFDITRNDLCLDVTGVGEYANKLGTVKRTVEGFDEKHESKTPLVAINGDMWMVSTAHARVEGSGTSYGGYNDAVVKQALTLPRSVDMYDGEIITGPQITAETPYQGQSVAFALTADGRSTVGTPRLKIDCANRTKGTDISVDGFNRLPANNALVLYSDKGYADNYALDDAYEVIIDCDYDYTVTPNAVITGRITGINKPGHSRRKMKANRLILTARGDEYKDMISGFETGDEIEFTFTLKAEKKNNDIWQNAVSIVGGNIILMKDGKIIPSGDESRIPASIIGNTADGHIVFITVDGRQSGYSDGMKICRMGQFLTDLGLKDALLLDGGGSTTIVNITKDGGYTVANKPSDKDSKGNNVPRSVVNSVILSLVATVAPSQTPVPTQTPYITADTTFLPDTTAAPVTTVTAAPTASGYSLTIAYIIGGVIICAVVVCAVIVAVHKNKHP